MTFVEAVERTAAERAAAAEAEWSAGPVRELADAELSRFLAETFDGAAGELSTELVSHVQRVAAMEHPYERVRYRVSSGTGSVVVFVDLWPPSKVRGVETPLRLWRCTFRSPRWGFSISPRRAARHLDAA